MRGWTGKSRGQGCLNPHSFFGTSEEHTTMHRIRPLLLVCGKTSRSNKVTVESTKCSIKRDSMKVVSPDWVQGSHTCLTYIGGKVSGYLKASTSHMLKLNSYLASSSCLYFVCAVSFWHTVLWIWRTLADAYKGIPRLHECILSTMWPFSVKHVHLMYVQYLFPFIVSIV